MYELLAIYAAGAAFVGLAVAGNFLRSNPPSPGVLVSILIASVILGAVWPLTVVAWVLLELLG